MTTLYSFLFIKRKNKHYSLDNIYYAYNILYGAVRPSLGWSVDVVVVVQASQ